MTNQESAGRYLCLLYYKGIPVKTVEKVLLDENNDYPLLSKSWRALMCGDLNKLNTIQRARFLGGGAWNPDLFSIDGHDGVSVVEWKLYDVVGRGFIRELGVR